MNYFYTYTLTNVFTSEEILTTDGEKFSINGLEEAALLLEVLNSGYVEQGEAPRVALTIKPIMVLEETV
ncbi:hypothetical protein [Cellulosilyticum sp. WCF-2]|uniref:hypothetical protein n=1 Tax=Cellulosilyticum sp. WCF-2 TaxID=2497860 RepID=UPI000F8D91F2|nr:hypothetical protein [Cellulosilyticum sp. WCF-2]QEH69753.1 hypothetical protein EKH84_15665 [Cellulosilyticum sp. WCF-2]